MPSTTLNTRASGAIPGSAHGRSVQARVSPCTGQDLTLCMQGHRCSSGRCGRENVTVRVLKYPAHECLAYTFAGVYGVLRHFRRRETSPVVRVVILDSQFPALLQAEASLCNCDKESAEAFKPTGILGLGGIFH